MFSRVITSASIILLALISLPSYAQEYVYSQQVTPFQIIDGDGNPFDFPFTGGLNRPVHQFVDTDGDGDLDLVVQDQASVLTLYRNTGTAQSAQFEWAGFPFDNLKVGDWFKFVDVDNDNDQDLFVENPYGIIRHYHNFGSPSVSSFVLATDTLRDISGNFIFSDGFSIPAWADIDCDGQQELLLGRLTGHITLYEHRGFDANLQPIYEHITDNFEDLQIITGGAPQIDPLDQLGGSRHGVNCLAFFDVDNDSDFDIFWGDFYAESLVFIENIGDCSTPEFRQESIVDHYPPQDPLETGGFNVPHFADIDNDGDQDMFIGVFGGALSLVSNSRDNFLFFENEGSVDEPLFEERTSEFLYTFDIGQNSIVEPFDLDMDGRQDLIIANQEDLMTENFSNSRLYWLKNQDDGGLQRFSMVNTDLLQDDQQFQLNYSPAFADLDNDGQAELYVGQWNGTILKYNMTGSGDQVAFQLESSSFAGIDAGNNSSPAFADIDNDGDLDLFIGGFDGRIRFYQNVGSPSQASFSLSTPAFFDISVFKYSVPAFGDINGDGDLDLLVGSVLDGVRLYRNIGTPSVPDFVPDTTLTLPAYNRMAPRFADFDQDNDLDIISGTASGGLVYFENGFDAALATPQLEPAYYTFEEIATGGSDSLTLSVFNRSNMASTVSTIALIGADPDQYRVEVSPFTLQPGESRRIVVYYQPTVNGSNDAYLQLQTNTVTLVSHLSGSASGEPGPDTPVQSFVLEQNYPNPFNGETVIKFQLPATPDNLTSPHELTVFNILGQPIRRWELAPSAGSVSGTLRWDGLGSNGNRLPSGLYFYRLTTNSGGALTKKLLLVR